MMERNAKPLGRPKADTWAAAFPKRAVLVGDSAFIRDADTYFSGHVRELSLMTIPADRSDDSALPPGFPIQGPWCLVCDLVTSSRSLKVARKILLNTSNVPFIALVGDPASIPDADLRSLLELGITHVLPVPGSWQEAWIDVRAILVRTLNPLLSVHSTKMWLLGVVQSVATQEKNCCVRVSSRAHGKPRAVNRDHGTSLRISPVGLLGEIYFREGEPVYAWSTRLQGDEALIDLLQTSNVQISVLDSTWMPPVRNVHSPLQGVLLEFMRRKDLGQLESPSTVISTEELQTSGPSTKHIPVPPSASKRLRWPLIGVGAAAVLIALLATLLKSPTTVEPPKPAPVAATPPKPVAPPPKPEESKEAKETKAPPKVKEPSREINLPLADRVPLEAVLIPAGRFKMGSPESERGRDSDEGPLRDVVIPAPFYMGRYEVTQEQYEAVMGQNPSQFRGPRHPVESVSSFDAQEFCERASRRLGREVRLPTEAEWEYACRAGTMTPFSTGDRISSGDANLDGRVGYGGSGDGAYRGKMVDVGTFPPNGFGLYDMHGNVGEWCADFYDPRAYDSSGAMAVPFSPSRPERVWRGGCYNDPPRRCRSANRDHYNPGGRDSCRGFRVVLPLEAPPTAAPADHH
jgi:formylglycine-generating enzyme required for sulfatase activity